jgi:protein-tyrosine phosphatase
MSDNLNLSWITDRLAVGGSFARGAAQELAEELQLAAVVDLRLEACDDALLLCRHGIDFLHLPTEDHCGVAPEMLAQGVAFAEARLARGKRVLVHCEHGIGRSATLALCILVARGLSPLEALALAKAKRALVSPSPAQYQCWIAWLNAFKHAHGAPWEAPSFDAFAAIAYSHLRKAG